MTLVAGTVITHCKWPPKLGRRGKVLAVDIQQEMLDLLEQRARPRGYKNIEPVLATLTDPKLPRGQLDLVLMVDVYHELSDPARILEAIYASLNETGRVVLVEFREEDPKVPIRPLHKMSQSQVGERDQREWVQAGGAV